MASTSGTNRPCDKFELKVLGFIVNQGETGCTTAQIAEHTLPTPPTEAIAFLMRSKRIAERENEEGMPQAAFVVATEKGVKDYAKAPKAPEPAKTTAAAAKGGATAKAGKGSKGKTNDESDSDE